MDIVKFDCVTKYYKKGKKIFKGIENISFNIKKGSIVGLIGPNGAGKSTSVKLLSGILKPDEGKVLVMDKEPYKDRKILSKNLGIMFGNRSSLWFNLPAIETAKLMKDIYGISNVNFNSQLKKYTDILKLENLLNKPVRNMSLGQKIKIELLITLLHDPELIILDEPSIGLDIIAKQSLRSILVDLAKEDNRTIILTTHDLSDVQKICDHIILINEGQKKLDLSHKEFEKIISDHSIVYIDKNGNIDFKEYSFYLREETTQFYKFIIKKDKTKDFIDNILNHSDGDINFKVEDPSLEDIFYEKYN